MFTRLRTSTAALAALIAVACAPQPVLAADPDQRRELCVETANIGGTAAAITAAADGAAQAQFIEEFNALPPDVQAFLLPYIQVAIYAASEGMPAQQVAEEIFGICMERRA